MFEVLLSGSLTVTCLVGLVAGLLAYWAQRGMRYMLPPGPVPLPLLGNMLRVDSKRLHEQVFEWSKTYGPVVSVYIGTLLVVYVNNIETALEVLVKKSTDFATRMRLTSIDVISEGGKNITFGEYGPSWRLHRKVSTKALREYTKGKKLEQRVWSAVTAAINEMEKHINEPFEATEYITYMVADLLIGLCFGGKGQYGDEQLHRILQYDQEIFFESNGVYLEDFIPPLRHIYKTKKFRKMEEFADLLIRDYMEKKFDEADKTFNKDHTRHFVDYLLLTRLEAEQEEGSNVLQYLTRTHLVQTCLNVFLAGIDTSRTTLCFAILYMLKYPDIQAKVQEEIDRVVGRDRLPGAADRPNLSYTEAVVHETMRLSTNVPSGLFHKTTCDTSAGGYDIPEGTLVAINHWALHNDPDAWEDVDKFKPERFLDENGKLAPKPQNWLPFSAGERSCIGEFVAKPELHLFFAALMQRFTWKPEPGVIPDLTPGGNLFGLLPNPYKVVIEKRI